MIYWLDVRTSCEYEAGHYPDAVNIPFNELASRISEVNCSHSTQINVYCKAGVRSGIAKTILESFGFSHVVNVGGLNDLPQC